CMGLLRKRCWFKRRCLFRSQRSKDSIARRLPSSRNRSGIQRDVRHGSKGAPEFSTFDRYTDRSFERRRYVAAVARLDRRNLLGNIRFQGGVGLAEIRSIVVDQRGGSKVLSAERAQLNVVTSRGRSNPLHAAAGPFFRVRS